MRQLNAPDTISGKEGVAYAKINGNNEELFFAKAVSATVTKSKSTINAIGKRLTGHKTTGGDGTGTLTMYYLTPLFRTALQDWKRSGSDLYFDLVVTNSDPDTAAGEQTVLLQNVNLDETILTQLDGAAEDALEEEVPFTFEDFEILTPFQKV